MLKGIACHGATVSDLDTSVAFYRDLLHMKLERTYEVAGEGLQEATGLPGAHVKVAMLSHRDGSGLHSMKLMQFLSPQGKKRFETPLFDVGCSHLALQLDNVQEAYDDLRAKGVKFFSPPVHPIPDHPWMMFTYFRDPDGMVLEFTRVPYHHAHVVADVARSVSFYCDTLGMKLDCILDISGTPIQTGTGLPGAHIMSAHTFLAVGEFANADHSVVLARAEYLELHDYLNPKGKDKSEIRLCDVGCTHIAFEVDDVQQAYQQLKAKGVNFVSEPVRQNAESPGVTMVYMLDPDAYVVELRSGPICW